MLQAAHVPLCWNAAIYMPVVHCKASTPAHVGSTMHSNAALHSVVHRTARTCCSFSSSALARPSCCSSCRQ